jgi:hypothetical protein
MIAEPRDKFIGRMWRRANKLANQGELSLAEMLNAYELLEQERDKLLDLLARALPYVEDLADDPSYKISFINRFAREIRSAVEQSK